MTTIFMSNPSSLPDPFGSTRSDDPTTGRTILFKPHTHPSAPQYNPYPSSIHTMSNPIGCERYPTPPFSPPPSLEKDDTIRASQSQGQGGQQTLQESAGGPMTMGMMGYHPEQGQYAEGDGTSNRSSRRNTAIQANAGMYNTPLSPPSDPFGVGGPLPHSVSAGPIYASTAPIPSFPAFHAGSHAPSNSAPVNPGYRPSSSRSSHGPGGPPQLVQPYPSPAAASPAATRKRATYNPSTQTTQTSPSPPRPGAELAIHPSIAAYQVAHPKRQLIHFGPYILLQKLGEGEFGKVKLGVHQEWGEEVAVKLIRRGSIENQAVRMSKVEREIEVLKNVKHPNIVRLFDVIETEKYIGIILDFANGGELFDHILAHRYLKEKDAAKLFAQLISGVHYLHSKKIIHRDLKLENLLLDKHRNVIITDFGFANRFEHKVDDLMATSCGSPCYAAPELVISEGLYVGSAVDVWSCGVILYAMLSGYLPFDDDPANPDGDNINLLYRYIVNTPLTYPEYLSAEAKDLLAMMLIPDPLHRCDLTAVMAHPWLSGYAPLFGRSVGELEANAQEQQQHKRLASRREMQARLRVMDQNRMAQLARNAKVAEANAAGLPASRSGPQQRHQSALPTLSTVPHHLNSLGQAARTSEFQRSVSPLAIEVQHMQSASDDTDTRAQFAHQRDLPARMDPFDQVQTATDTAPPLLEPPRVVLPSASFARPEPVETAPVAAVPKEKRPASQNKNRHTIQVEYDGEATYGKMIASQETRRAEAEAERSALRQGLLALDQPMRIDPDEERTSPAAAGCPPSEMDVDTPPPPQTPPKQSRTMREDETPRASRNPNAVAPETPTGLGIHGTPVEGPSRDIETPRAPSRTVAEGIAYREEQAIPQPALPLPAMSPPQRTASGSTISSTNSARQARDLMPMPPPDRTMSGSSTDQSAHDLPSQVDTRDGSRPPVSGKSSTRSKRGMSMDKFSLGKLLGSGNASTDNVARPPSRAKESNTTVLHRNPSTRSRVKAAAAKPSLSVAVHPDPQTRPLQPSFRPGSQTPSTGVGSPAVGATPMSPMFPSQNPSVRITQPGGFNRHDAGSAADAIDPYGPGKEGDKRSRHTSMASSSAAKKVMDWFRRKSMARTSFAGPIGSSAEHSKSGNLDTDYPGGQGVLVPSAVALRVEGTSVSSSTSGGSQLAVDRVPQAAPPPIAASSAENVRSDVKADVSKPSTASVRVPPPRAPPPPPVQALIPLTSQAPSRQNSTKRKSARPSTAGGVISSIASAIPAKPAAAASSPDSYLRAHNGVVDQAALTNRPAPEVMEEILRVLYNMGIEIKRESEYKLRCTRPNRKKVASGAAFSPGSRSGSVVSFGVGGSASAGKIDARGLPIPQSPSTGLLSATGGFKGMLMRRGSTQTSISAQLSPDMASPSLTASTAPESPREGAGQPEPLYGDHSIDSGDEVRFMVEVTRIKNLPGLLSLDIKRLKGNVWSYKFIYQTALQRCHTLTH